MEKTYEIPNYLLNMLKNYKDGIKHGSPSLDDFLENKPEYEDYVNLIKKHTKSDVDFKSLAGKFLIDGDVTGYDTEFDKLLFLLDSINQQIAKFVTEANELVVSGNYFGKPSRSDKVSRVFLRVKPGKCLDNIEIYIYTSSLSFPGLVSGVDFPNKEGRSTVITLKGEQGCIDFNGLNAHKLYSSSCTQTVQGKATKYMESKLFSPEFRDLISTLNDSLYYIYQGEKNPMDILIK
jgi:hypothetical protein